MAARTKEGFLWNGWKRAKPSLMFILKSRGRSKVDGENQVHGIVYSITQAFAGSWAYSLIQAITFYKRLKLVVFMFEQA